MYFAPGKRHWLHKPFFFKALSRSAGVIDANNSQEKYCINFDPFGPFVLTWPVLSQMKHFSWMVGPLLLEQDDKLQATCDELQPLCDELQPQCDELQPLCDELQPPCDELQPPCDELQSTCDELLMPCEDLLTPRDGLLPTFELLPQPMCCDEL